MRTTLLVSSLSTLLLSSCAHRATIGHGASTELLFPADNGAQQAHRDISVGLLQIMEAGTRGVYAPNVPMDARFSNLPRHRLPSGCTVPTAGAWVRYAEAYNSVVVAYIQKRGKR